MSKSPSSERFRDLVLHATEKKSKLSDPWEKYDIENKYVTERVLCHRYKQEEAKWTKVSALVKMESEAFANGSMRRCFRMKKIPQAPNQRLTSSALWPSAHNYVAKQYLEETGKETYFDDVRLQAMAEYWALEFNRFHSVELPHGPPKKVDIINIFVVEFIDRADSPVFTVERYIDGKYIKHNSNCGYVEEEMGRLTPQCFSHFTFERAQGKMMVVDIQGVDDLYTDPQIHSWDNQFGEGDLGQHGMSLFFQTHECNDLCMLLGLTQFPSADSLTLKTFDLSDSLDFCKTETGVLYAPIHLDHAKILRKTQILGNGSDNTGLSVLYHLHQTVSGHSVTGCIALARLYSGKHCIDDEDPLLPTQPKLPTNPEIANKLWEIAAEEQSKLALWHLSEEYYQNKYFLLALEKLKLLISLRDLPNENDDEEIEWGKVFLHTADILVSGEEGTPLDKDAAIEYYLEGCSEATMSGDMYTAGECMRRMEEIDGK